jgi:hypothetical protein
MRPTLLSVSIQILHIPVTLSNPYSDPNDSLELITGEPLRSLQMVEEAGQCHSLHDAPSHRHPAQGP